MRRAFLGVGLALVLSACESTPTTAPVSAPVSRPTSSHPPPPPPPKRDQCGAADLQHLVGRPRTEIPVPLRPDLQRVACTTCPVTMDYNQNRLNFFYDAETGKIAEIRCG